MASHERLPVSKPIQMTDTFTDSQLDRLDSGELAVIVPEGCVVPPELQSTTPREVPEEIRRRRQLRVPFVTSWVLLALFVAAVAAGARPFGPPWSQISFGLATIVGLLGLVGVFTSRRELRYVRDGLVGAGYIRELNLQPAAEYNGQVIALKHVVTLMLELSNNDSGLHEFTGLQVQADGGPRSSLRVGDLIPIVWVPGRFRKTAVPYSFLRFNHDHVLKKPAPKKNRAIKVIGTAFLVIAMFSVLIGNLLILMWCVPVAMNTPIVIATGIVGALVPGGLMFGGILWQLRREDARTAERNRQAIADGTAIQLGSSHVMLTNSLKGWIYRIVVGAGSLLLGGLTTVLWAFAANQLFDGHPVSQPVVEIDTVQKIKGSQRTKLTFHRIDEPQLECSKEYVARDLPQIPLFVGQRAQVTWHPGAFGWPWIEDLRMVEPPKPQ